MIARRLRVFMTDLWATVPYHLSCSEKILKVLEA